MDGEWCFIDSLFISSPLGRFENLRHIMFKTCLLSCRQISVKSFNSSPTTVTSIFLAKASYQIALIIAMSRQ